MNSSTGFVIADICDIVAYTMFFQVSTTEVLNWVYTIVLILSVAFGIGMKVYSAVKDGKITKQEEEEIRKELEETQKKLEEEINKNKEGHE